MKSKPNEHLTVRVNPIHLEILNQAAGSSKVNYSAQVRYAIEQTYGQKKVG